MPFAGTIVALEWLFFMQGDNNDFDLKGRLLDKSFDAYVLALETINRITIRYRLEAFCYLICNAWELLLKAKILDDSKEDKAIFYSQQEGPVRRSLSLRQSLSRVFPNEKEPVRRNIERIEELRDEAVHLVIAHIPAEIMALFQAGVVNYHKNLREWFNRSLSDQMPVGMMSIVYDLSPENTALTNNRLGGDLGPQAFEFLSRFCADIRKEFDELSRPSEFSITIEYRLLVDKKSENADMKLSSGPSDHGPTQVVEVPKDPSLSHPYRQKDLIEYVKSQVPDIKFNAFDVKCLNEVYGIKNRPEYYYQGRIPNSPTQYSPAIAEWIIEHCKKDSQFLKETRERQKQVREAQNKQER